MLTVQKLEKVFRSQTQTTQALSDVSFQVQAGEIVALLGANGAGKTTTIRMIAGLIVPDSGAITLHNFPPNSREYNVRLGVLLDTARSSAARLSVMENLEYTATLRGLTPRVARSRALELVRELDLEDKKDAPVQTLSKGMLSKLSLATAVMHDPQCLLLDEPTLGLDIDASDALENRILGMAERGRAILLTTHQMEVAQRLATRVVILARGRVVADCPKHDLLSHFQAQTYRITFEQAVDELDLECPFHIEQNVLTLTLLEPGMLYAVMDALRPRRIVNINRLEADLGAVFRRIVNEARGSA
jgi:ABC-2 type transport system ATP-binding protein